MKTRIYKIYSPIKKHLSKYIKIYQIIFIPLIFSPIPIAINHKVDWFKCLCFNFWGFFCKKEFLSFFLKEAYCGYVLLIMLAYWVTECIPIPVAALLPIVLFPAFGILSSRCTTQIFFSVNSFPNKNSPKDCLL